MAVKKSKDLLCAGHRVLKRSSRTTSALMSSAGLVINTEYWDFHQIYLPIIKSYKYFLFLLSFVALSMAQRPTYAGTSAKGYPELASRFAAQDAPDMSNQATVVNRLGDPDSSDQKIPVDARGDAVLVSRLNQWPRENRPFWLINSDHIENHRRTGVAGQTQSSDQTNDRQIQTRFGGLEANTIKPASSRGFFAATNVATSFSDTVAEIGNVLNTGLFGWSPGTTTFNVQLLKLSPASLNASQYINPLSKYPALYLLLILSLQVVSAVPIEFVALQTYDPSSSGYTSFICSLAIPFLYLRSITSEDVKGLPSLVQTTWGSGSPCTDFGLFLSACLSFNNNYAGSFILTMLVCGDAKSDGLQPWISIVITPSECDIEYSYLLSSRLSLYHLTVGNGFPLRQHSSLQVSLSCMTRGLSRKVKLGAHSCSSCQNVYGKGSRRLTCAVSGLYSGTTVGKAGI
ncbi:hypothetical protein HUJ04_012472 [Dendroctonus ponderosae]|nr:hypothetical protein HUJ04_012472 [Dendroctonus ponderosae]